VVVTPGGAQGKPPPPPPLLLLLLPARPPARTSRSAMHSSQLKNLRFIFLIATWGWVVWGHTRSTHTSSSTAA
jgi:hypothetical protein